MSTEIRLQVGEYELVAEGPMRSCLSSTSDGAHPPTWQMFYNDAALILESTLDRYESHDELYFVRDHRVESTGGEVVSPIIDYIAIINSGYMITWSCEFWREGFCVYNGRLAFMSIGNDEGYCTFGAKIRFVTGGEGVRVDRAGIEQFLSQESVDLTASEAEALETLSTHYRKWPHEFR